jgi:hypothetical protein
LGIVGVALVILRAVLVVDPSDREELIVGLGGNGVDPSNLFADWLLFSLLVSQFIASI